MIEILQLEFIHVVESQGDENIVTGAGSAQLGCLENANPDGKYGKNIAIVPSPGQT